MVSIIVEESIDATAIKNLSEKLIISSYRLLIKIEKSLTKKSFVLKHGVVNCKLSTEI